MKGLCLGQESYRSFGMESEIPKTWEDSRGKNERWVNCFDGEISKNCGSGVQRNRANRRGERQKKSTQRPFLLV